MMRQTMHRCRMDFQLNVIRLVISDSFVHSPRQESVTSVSLTLPVPALQVHILGVPPAETLFVGQEAHTPKEG